MPVVVNEGTQTTVASIANSGTQYQIVKLDIGGGSAVSDFGGTLPVVTTVANLTNGTVRVSVGTITGGTLQNLNTGTVQIIGLRHADEFATVVSTGTNTLGTIRAAVTGSQIFVTGIAISVGSASNVVIGNGGTSLPLLGTLFFNANGGIALTPIDPPLRTTAGSALVYQQSAAISSMTITCVGYID